MGFWARENEHANPGAQPPERHLLGLSHRNAYWRAMDVAATHRVSLEDVGRMQLVRGDRYDGDAMVAVYPDAGGV